MASRARLAWECPAFVVSVSSVHPVIAVVGPTATGKSELGIALATRLDGEIVNADAMQLYRGMDIGTAKVRPDERGGIPHHQLDVLDVSAEASVAHYQLSARADISAIVARGRRPIVVGGSGLYVRALLDRFDFPGTDDAIRGELERRADEHGPGVLHRELRDRDPVAAESIDPRNARRIIRALEVIEITGAPYSSNLPTHEYEIPAIQIGIAHDIDVLDRRIEERVGAMWAAGLVGEVERLIDEGLRQGRTAQRAVGYAETLRYLDGALSETETPELIARNTRRLARRQRRWFEPDKRVRWVSGFDDALATLEE